MLRPRARRDSPQTSWDAARSVENVSDVQGAILRLYALYGPMTDTRLIEAYKLRQAGGKHHDGLPLIYPPCSESGIRTRRNELVKARLVKNMGWTDKLPTGRQAIVWGPKEER